MAFKVYDMTVNHTAEPIGIDDLPYFSYKLQAEYMSEKLTAYRICVENKKRTVWDSGKVDNDRQVLIKYEGEDLEPETEYTWRVTAWNDKGEVSESETACFETGRMSDIFCDAKWITATPKGVLIGDKRGDVSTAPYLRRKFQVSGDVDSAVLYISGLGYYECYINGASVKDSVLDPAFTEYDKAVCYRTHKISNLKQGENAIAISLGDGFYNGDTEDVWNFVNATWRDHAKCICVLKICYSDGRVEKIVSDSSFKGTVGPIVTNHIRTNDRYDARLELGNWTEAEYNDSGWVPVTITKAPGGIMTGQYTVPIRVTKVFSPVEIRQITDTTRLFDAGENTSGWAEISLTAEEGTEITLRYAEDFDENLQPMRGHAGCLKPSEKENFQTDTYVASGRGKERWHPTFKYHGFRYILVKCDTGIPKDLELKIHKVHTDLSQTGDFTCSDEMVNTLQEVACRSTLTNFHNMPTDCPHREKNGWTGDAQIASQQLLYNFDGFGAYSRWMDDVIRAQRPSGQLPGIIPSTGWGYNWGSGPAWDSVCAVIPYNMYLLGGDKRIIEKMHPCVKKYLAFCDCMATDGICSFGLGDWCPPPEKSHKQCETSVTDTAIYYSLYVTASKMADILELSAEAESFMDRAMEIRGQFRKRFIKDATDTLELQNCTRCQTSIAAMLYHGLVNSDEKAVFISALKDEIAIADNHFDTGFIGAKYVCDVLCEAGEAELALKMITVPTYPSYAYMINSGATTLWEHWNGNCSQNHHMHGHISAFFYKALAGINADEKAPGFKHTLFKPQFVSGIDWVKAHHDSPYGRVASEWKRSERGIEVKVTVPVNCTGTVILPDGEHQVIAGEHSFFVE